MDRTAWIVIILCTAGLFWWGSENAKRAAEYRKAQEEKQAAEENLPEGEKGKGKGVADGGKPEDPVETEPPVDAKTVEMVNREARYILTNHGAGIASAELLSHRFSKDDEALGFVTLNRDSKHPIGALSTGPGRFDETVWKVESESGTEVVYSTVTAEQFEVEKRFTMPGEGEDPNLIHLSISVRNANTVPLQLGNRFLYAGSASPLHIGEWPRMSGVFWHETAGDMEHRSLDSFKKGGFLGMGGTPIASDEYPVESLQWAGVNSQFFTTIFTPDSPYTTRNWGSFFEVEIPGEEQASKKNRMRAIEAGIGLPDTQLNPGDQHTLTYDIYIGPKEFARLDALGDGRTAVMNYDDVPLFGWLFGWAIKPLASLLIQFLVFLKGFVGQYGIAIILVTIIIRIVIWPVYAKSTRTMKRMSKLTPKMKEIKEKHKDNQQKQSEEMMKLYREYGVNPLGGCLPMFIQLPVFLAFYGMLWRASELRHEEFLWVRDLSMPDTLAMIGGFPINILPIIMAITTFIQMSMTPKTGDKTQRMIFMLMPVFFLVICYNFASALALYWTTQNIFSIGQTWLMNKLPEPELKKKKKASGKKGFFQRMQEQAQAAQEAKKRGGGQQPAAGGPGGRTKLASEKGERHTKSKKRKKR